METKKITLDLWDYSALVALAAGGWTALFAVVFTLIARNS